MEHRFMLTRLLSLVLIILWLSVRFGRAASPPEIPSVPLLGNACRGKAESWATHTRQFHLPTCTLTSRSPQSGLETCRHSLPVSSQLQPAPPSAAGDFAPGPSLPRHAGGLLL